MSAPECLNRQKEDAMETEETSKKRFYLKWPWNVVEQETAAGRAGGGVLPPADPGRLTGLIWAALFLVGGALAQSIRNQLPYPDEAPPVKELFSMVDQDLKQNGQWYGKLGMFYYDGEEVERDYTQAKGEVKHYKKTFFGRKWILR